MYSICIQLQTQVVNSTHMEAEYLSVVVIDHNIMRLNISVHYAHTVTVIQGLQ